MLKYNGSYQNTGLNAVNKNIIISQNNLNNAISNLSKFNNDNKQTQTTKDDLVQIIFITSESMRFGSYIKYFNYEKDGKKIEFKNIQEDIQNIINSINDNKIQWKNYSEQLIGGWMAASKYLEQRKKEIFQDLKLYINYFMIQDISIKILKKNKKELILNKEGLEMMNKIFFNVIEKYIFLDSDQKLIKIWEKQKEKTQEEEEIKNLNKLINKEKNMKNNILMLLKSIFFRIIKIVETNELFSYCHYDKKITYNELNNMEEIPLLSVLVIKNNLDFIKLLIWKKPEIINAINKSGNTPLHYACLFDVIDEKIDQKMINEKINDFHSYSRLVLQPKESNDEIEESKNNLLIQFLLENSPKEIINKPNKSGNTPLHLAIYSDNIKAVELFIQKAKELYGEQSQQFKDFINAKNNFNNTPLHFSVQQFGTIKIKNINIIKLLLANGAEINTENNDNLTPLFAVSFNNNIKAFKLLIKEAKKLYNGCFSEEFKKIINIKSKKYKMLSPIYIAIHQNNIGIVKLLFKNGADEDINMIYQNLDCCKIKNNNNFYLKKQRDKLINFLNKYYELNKKITEDEKLINNLSEKFTPEQKEQLKNKIKKRIENNIKELNELLKIKISDLIKETDLMELPDNNSPETILNKLIKLNPNLDISKVKLNENNITDNSAIIESIDKIYPDDKVKVTFIINKKTNNSNYQQKQKNDDYENNIGNKKNYPVKNQSIKYVNSSGMQNQNNLYDVLPDNSCLFWSVATAYLLPVRNNYEKFKTRFIQLFGEKNLKYLQLIQKLLQQHNLKNNRSLNQLLYQNQTANNLITSVFRNRVVDYIQSHLDTIPTRNGELTFRNLIQENNEINSSYLKIMRQPSTWGGLPEIIAMANILNANISVNNDAPYQPINQNSTNTINIFHVNNGTHYNFALLENVEVNNTNSQEKTTTVKNQQKLTVTEQPKTNIKISNKSTGSNNNNAPISSVNKPININIANSQETTTKKTINKYNSLSKEEKQQKLNEINQHYKSLPENEQKAFKDKLRDVGLGLTSAGISGAGILGISKMTGISPIKSLSTTANYIRNSLSATETGEAVEMTPLLSKGITVAEGLTAAETLSVAEGTTVVATEGAVIGSEAGAAAALAPETLGLSLLIGGLAIAGTALIWWLSGHDSNIQAVKHESHNQYNEIEKYYKFLANDQLKLDINVTKWDKIKQIYQENSNNYQEFKNKIKSKITNFHKEDHSGWGGSINDNDINTLINIIYNNFKEINNHFSSNPNHGWKIVTNTIGSYFIIEEE